MSYVCVLAENMFKLVYKNVNILQINRRFMLKFLTVFWFLSFF
jgi:hypothetical protein